MNALYVEPIMWMFELFDVWFKVARERALEEKEENKQRQKEENEMWHNKLLDLVRKSEEREMNDKKRQVQPNIFALRFPLTL